MNTKHSSLKYKDSFFLIYFICVEFNSRISNFSETRVKWSISKDAFWAKIKASAKEILSYKIIQANFTVLKSTNATMLCTHVILWYIQMTHVT